jgi:hypothetical protein
MTHEEMAMRMGASRENRDPASEYPAKVAVDSTGRTSVGHQGPHSPGGSGCVSPSPNAGERLSLSPPLSGFFLQWF